MSVKREEVAKWANEEAGVTGLLESPVEPPSWKHGYIIYLKMFYEIHDKWQQATDPVKLQQLHRKMNKLVKCSLNFMSFLRLTSWFRGL